MYLLLSLPNSLLLILLTSIASLVIADQLPDEQIEAASQTSGPKTQQQQQLELVDLMECGKTFLYTKYLISVKLAQTSDYNQRPVTLMQSDPSTTGAQLIANSSSNGFVAENRKPRELRRRQASARFVLRGPKRPTASGGQDPLRLDIEPVVPPHNQVSRRPPALAELAGLLVAPQADDKAAPRVQLPLAYDEDRLDPVVAMAMELGVEPKEVNKTLVDCFMVDLDKRYTQRMQIEERFRQKARVRRVSFAQMLALTTKCRQLTWQTLMANRLEMAASSEEPSVESGPDSALNSWVPLLSSWFGSRESEATSHDDDDEETPRQRPEARNESTSHPSVGGRQQQSMPPPTERQQVDAIRQNNGTTNSIGYQEDRRQASYLSMGLSMMTGIVPNTLWCGLGDRASNYSELGAEFKVDSCCRSHDHCPIRMKPFSSDYGLVNWSVSSRLHCDCDEEFNACLLDVNSNLSNVVRVLYFRFVGLQCIDVQGTTRLRPQNITLT